MRHARSRVGIALTLSTSLVISAVSATEATAAPQPPSQGTMLLAQDANAPIKVEGTTLILFGNRVPLGLAAFGLLAAIGGAVGIAALATGNFGRSENNGSSSNGSSRKNPPKYGDRTAYDEDGDQAEINPQARGITTENALLLFPSGASQIGQTVAIDDDALVTLNLKEGDVLSIPPSPQFPVGQLAKIESVETEVDSSRVVTKQAALSDIILQTDGDFDLPAAGVDYEFQPAEGVAIKEMSEKTDFQQHGSFDFNGFSIEFSPTNILEQLNPQWAKKFEKFDIGGSYELDASVSVDRSGLNIDKTTVDLTNTLAAEISLNTKEQSNQIPFEKNLGSHIARFRFFAGPVPIYLSTSGDLHLKGETSFSAKRPFTLKAETTVPFEAEFDLSGKSVSVQSEKPSPSIDMEKDEQSTGISFSVGPAVDTEVTFYGLFGLSGEVALKFVASILRKLTDWAADLKVLFSWTISGFMQLFDEKFRVEKEFFGDEKPILERTVPLGGQSKPAPSQHPSPTTTPPTKKEDQDSVRVEGVVKKLSRDQAARYGRIPNGEGPDSIYYVIELDGPTSLPAKSAGNFRIEKRDGINQVAVGALEYFPTLKKPSDSVGIWKYYEGMRVSLEYDPDKTYWNSGPRLPVGALQVGNYKNLKFVPSGTCEKTLLLPNLKKDVAERFNVSYCDGTFARVGWPQSDDIRYLVHANGSWSLLPADRTVKDGLTRSCFNAERIDALSPPQAFRRNLPICKPEDLGYFPTY